MKQLQELVERYSLLQSCAESIRVAYELLKACYEQDSIVYVCGNGGSASDAEHIVGELMKSFAIRRPLPEEVRQTLDDPYIAEYLEGALRAVALTGQLSLSTAYANDAAPDLVFAQQVFGYGRPGDVLWALSTSGNSQNVIHALKVAQAKGMKTLGLSGQSGGRMAALCDVCICVPEVETYKVQELHLPVYHTLCRMLETHYFTEKSI